MPASTDLVASIKKGNTGNAMLVTATVGMMPRFGIKLRLNG
jgi:hypothetical protein